MLRLSILIVQFVVNLVVTAARETRWLFAGFCNKVRILPLGPDAVFRLHGVGRQLKLEDSIFAAGKFQHEQPLRRAKIKLDVTGAHARIFRPLCVPITRHRITVSVELRFSVSKSFEGLTGRRFHFEFEMRCRTVEVQNMRLSCIPNSETGRSDRCDRDTNPSPSL